MFEEIGNILINEKIIKENLELYHLLNLRMSCKLLYKYTDINNKDNNEFLWKFYYLKNQLNNYKILPTSKNIKSNLNRNTCYEWYRRIYYPCKYKYIDKNMSIDEVFDICFKERDLYLKELFNDCCNKLLNFDHKKLYWNEIYSFWKEIGSPSIHLDHYDLSTCSFECNKKPINYKCFFIEIAKRYKTKYKKFLSLKENNENVCQERINEKKYRIQELEKELERENENLEKIQKFKIKKDKIEVYINSLVKTKKK